MTIGATLSGLAEFPKSEHSSRMVFMPFEDEK
jgi:hypothetical protein